MSNEKQYGLNGTQVWPTMFFTRLWESHALEAPGILKQLTHMQHKQTELIESGIAVGAKSEQGLYESTFDLFSDPDAGLQKLVHFIESSLALAVSVANNQEVPPQDLQIEFADSWYHVTNDGGFHDAHFHNGCSWCGIYYLQVGDSGQRRGKSAPNGGSRFYCPFNAGGGYRDYGNKYLSATIDPPLADGLLLIFPSYLLHSGLPYRGTNNRVVIAFNAMAFLKPGSVTQRLTPRAKTKN